jgi:hypothetical protein
MTTGVIVKVTMRSGWKQPTLALWLVSTDNRAAAIEAVRRHTKPDWKVEFDRRAPDGLVERKGLLPGQACSL